MPDRLRAVLRKRLVPNPKRAAEIREIFHSSHGEPLMQRLWPEIKVIVTGTAAEHEIYERQLRQYTGDLSFFHRGYTASEGLFTIPEKLNDRDGLLLADSAFYEFVLEDGQIVTMDQLKEGMRCTLLVTNGSGLYRYPMGDLLEITGFCNTCPKVRLLGRENRTLNLTTEKLHMPLVNEAVEKACAAVGVRLLNYTVYADRAAIPLPHYTFYLEMQSAPDMEHLRSALIGELRNISDDFSHKLDSGKIGTPVVRKIENGTWESYMRPLWERAARESRQVKPVCLLTTSEEAAYFEAHIV